MKAIIRSETPADYRAVENLTCESFWNVYKPGADEHYFVHMMRSHPDFLPELAFMLECDGEAEPYIAPGVGSTTPGAVLS